MIETYCNDCAAIGRSLLLTCGHCDSENVVQRAAWTVESVLERLRYEWSTHAPHTIAEAVGDMTFKEGFLSGIEHCMQTIKETWPHLLATEASTPFVLGGEGTS